MSEKEFCKPDANDENHPKWSLLDTVLWKLTPNWNWLGHYSGQDQLMGYKKAWISYNKSKIIFAAELNLIPSDFLGCVIFNEVGGDPPWIKRNIVLPARQYLPKQKSPQNTSEGAIKIQLQAALSVLGHSDAYLSREQQNELTACLENDTFNIQVVAAFLRKMILFDYPKIDTRILNDEQFAVAGCRYNRGTARPLADFLQSLKDEPGQSDRVFTSYGRAMLRHRAEVRKLLEL